jgi:hypothetical protein
MIPVLETVQTGAQAALRFARTYRAMLVVAAAIYAAAAALPMIAGPRLHLHGWLAPHLLDWALSLPATILLAPVWIALNRFVVIGDTERRYLSLDVRLGRMLFVLLTLSVIGMLGGAPFAFALDFNPGLNGRMAIGLSILAGAAVSKALAWWLQLRLAIAPAMAAAGTRKRPLDTAFGYTGGRLWRIVAVRLLIYLPLLAMAGVLIVTGRLAGPLRAGALAQPAIVVVVTILTACTELVDAAAMARIARLLAGRRAPATPVTA